jgi:uncharacterized protein YjbI with pentapeptide repeats
VRNPFYHAYLRFQMARFSLRNRAFQKYLSARRMRLGRADLSFLDLSGARLRGGNLREANLIRSDLSGADLREADLAGADMSGAILREADLTGANLLGADVSAAQLGQTASVEGATLPDGTVIVGRASPPDSATDASDSPIGDVHILRWSDLSAGQSGRGAPPSSSLSGAVLRDTDLAGTDLRGANLQGAALERADLSDADLRGANLLSASLSGADLRGANLKGALVTDEQLATARSTAGAIMPDGRTAGSDPQAPASAERSGPTGPSELEDDTDEHH